MANVPDKVVIGIDVGSTTVKMTVVDPRTKEILWSKYLRHETRQPEMTRDMLREIHAAFPTIKNDKIRVFITGSGGSPIAPQIGAKFVQEVNAVSLAVEKLYPECNSVVELGGQDAKIIIFKEDEETGRKRKIPSMNDKCAGGTGSVIDKINLKRSLGLGYSRGKSDPLPVTDPTTGLSAETRLTVSSFRAAYALSFTF